MVSTYLFVGLLIFLFVSLSLILGLGLVNMEQQRAADDLASDEAAGGELGTSAHGVTPARRGRSVDDLVTQLEAFVRKEAEAVSAFVSAPSVGGLVGDASADAGPGGSGESVPEPS